MIRERLHSITLQKLRIFAVAARERSFTKAADAVLLSPPAVSDQIKSLEGLIGMKLLHRSRGRGAVELTEAGQILLRSYDEVSQSLERADKDLEALRQLQLGAVILGTSPMFEEYVLSVVFGAFQQAYPGIKVRVDYLLNLHCLENLGQHKLDLAVLLGMHEQPGIVFEPLIPCYLVPVGPPGHRLAEGTPVPFNELAKERLILGGPTTHIRSVVEKMASDAGVALNVFLELSDVLARLHAVERGLGITILTPTCVASKVEAGMLSMLRIQGFPTRTEWVIAYPANQISRSTKALRDHLLGSRNCLDAISAVYNRILPAGC